MANLNKVFLIGNLTRDPELRRTTNGAAVTDLRLAINRYFLTKDGERRDEVLYIDVTVWNRQAENCCQYLRKGRPVHVEGFLRMETWDDKTTGTERSKLKVEAERVQFLDSRRDDAGADAMSADDDYGAPVARDPRRTAPGPESRGGNGPSRGLGAPAHPSPRRPPMEPPDSEGEDDIPF